MLAYLFLVMALAVRIMSGVGIFGTMGFAPLGASLLFFGSRMPRKHYALALAALIATDVYITNHHYGMAVTWDQGFTWAWYVGAFFLGSLLKNRVKPLYVLGAGAASALSFFAVSNFGVWIAGILYPRTWEGLVACYTAALPFLRRGLESDVLFSIVLFSVPVLISQMSNAAVRKEAI
jgi:hypothetical protein